MIHWHIWEPRLTDAEITSLAMFLGALTDEAFMPETPKAVPSGLPLRHRLETARDNIAHLGAQ